jgi:hypothetical protein
MKLFSSIFQFVIKQLMRVGGGGGRREKREKEGRNRGR